MAINYSTVITKKELELIKPDDYKKIRLICKAKINELRNKSFFTNTTNNMQQRAIEFAFSSKFIDMSYTQKTLIASNVLYFNNNTFINLLISKGITYKMLSTIISRISYIKKLALLKK